MTAASHLLVPENHLWYAIQTRYRFEKKVTTQLQRKGIETFLPVLEQIHHWSDREKRVNTLLFSGYTFARINPSSWSRMDLLRTVGVIGLIAFAGQVIPIPAKQIDDLQMLLSQKVPCALRAFLKIGQRVRIRGGCLDGLEGILDERGEKNLVISVDSIQRSVAMRIEGYELELI
ncbi:putative NusG antitermination factor [Candidatus Sulfotelmatobacter kueseliae]|uniref:Putative NusG antitermination factor n=1 Tax=Candidatus Sulfotelmatobacter kueseliae TaxID=2042962 RepID=A0A2U3K182_9BACT|nr:putative NusG antitermination factor [Candidatus Sulfotelmatobacter kueseliae]